MVIMDEGITNLLQKQLGKFTVTEWDYYRIGSETDNGNHSTHGNVVFQSALSMSRAYDVIDLKVGGSSGALSSLVELALDDVASNGSSYNIASINMSFGGSSYPLAYADEISLLASRGILTVAAASNSGNHSTLESASYPALLSNVIAVGSHDGRGKPSGFSQNGPGVDILADGEDMPAPGLDGTSFAAPRVAATVTHVQAIVEGLTGTRLSVGQMIDALQLGGAGPLSKPDPADGTTRYFLHDHEGSLGYAWSSYGGYATTALEYVASHADLGSAFGANANAGRLHFVDFGAVEERAVTFDGLEYVASHADLVAAFGADAHAGASHYIASGRHEGRAVTFDGLQYVASHGDLIQAFGANGEIGGAHYIGFGYGEGRAADTFDAARYLANHADLQVAFGTDQEAATRHYISHGFAEGRADEPAASAAALAFADAAADDQVGSSADFLL
jgi:Subtilase family